MVTLNLTNIDLIYELSSLEIKLLFELIKLMKDDNIIVLNAKSKRILANRLKIRDLDSMLTRLIHTNLVKKLTRTIYEISSGLVLKNC